MFSKGQPNQLPGNSSNKFVNQIKHNGSVGNRSFDATQRALEVPKYKQTKLSLGPPSNKKSKLDINHKNEFILLPPPNKQPTASTTKTATTAKIYQEPPKMTHTSSKGIPAATGAHALTDEDENKNKSPLSKNGRDMLCLIGKVDFCLKTHKLHADLSAIWDIYGKLLKITNGKQRFEQVLLLRNPKSGPILQSIYYDFDGLLQTFQIGCFLRVVGRFVGLNRLQTFKVEFVSENTWEQNFIRIQNVTSFLLMQNNLMK